jgi:hypothetical protein
LSDAKLSLQGSKDLRAPPVDLLRAQRAVGMTKCEAPSEAAVARIDALPRVQVEEHNGLQQLAGRAPNDAFDFGSGLLVTNL